MNYPKIISLVFLLQLLIFQSCKKESAPPEVINYSKFSGKALQYVQLTVGKYFIYKDSATGQTDSVIVTKSEVSEIFQPKQAFEPAYYSQQFKLVLSKYTGAAQTTWFTGNALSTATSLPNFFSDTSAVLLSEEDNTPVFYSAESTRPDYSITIEGKVYNNVIVTINDSGVAINNPGYKLTTYYWAKGVGIIKRTTITTGGVVKTYTLLRSN